MQEPADNIQAGQKIWFATEEEGRDLYLSGKDVTFVKANEDYAPITEKLDTLQFLASLFVWMQLVAGARFDVSNAVHVYV